MTQKIALIILLVMPILRTGIGIGRDLASTKPNKSTSIVAGLLLAVITYMVFYFAGIFNLWP